MIRRSAALVGTIRSSRDWENVRFYAELIWMTDDDALTNLNLDNKQ